MTRNRMSLSPAQADSAAGVLWGQACGDALGAGYEFGPPLGDGAPVAMIGGGAFGWEPGEWTDDTQMAVPLLEAAEKAMLDGGELLDHLDDVAIAWVDWSRTASDVGNQTRAVLGGTRRSGQVTADSMTLESMAQHQATGQTAGNGSLMRTSPVALAYLGDPETLALAARRVSSLTHWDDDARDACVLWCLAISHAVVAGEFDIEAGLPLIPEERRDLWRSRIAEAESKRPVDFPRNGWVVHAFQAAWSAIATTSVPELDPSKSAFPAQQFRLALENAVRAGHDTDTVAAITGQLLGARWGSSAVPGEWRRIVHGWPGLSGRELAGRGLTVARGGPDASGWPMADRIDYAGWGARGRLVAHPYDAGVLLGDAAVLDELPPEVDAVVSLCRVGRDTAARVRGVPSNQVEAWLIDVVDPAANPHLDFVLSDLADTIVAMRSEGRTVLVHCVAAQSRTPTVAAAYAVRHLGVDPGVALAEVCAALPDPSPNAAFVAAVHRMTPGGGS